MIFRTLLEELVLINSGLVGLDNGIDYVLISSMSSIQGKRVNIRIGVEEKSSLGC